MDIGLICSFAGITINLIVVRYSICGEMVIREQRKMMENFEKYSILKKTPMTKPTTIYGHIFKSDEFYKFQHDVMSRFMKVTLRRTFFLDQYKPYPVYIRKLHSKNRYKNYYTNEFNLQKLSFYYKKKPLKSVNTIPVGWHSSDAQRWAYMQFRSRQLQTMRQIP